MSTTTTGLLIDRNVGLADVPSISGWVPAGGVTDGGHPTERIAVLEWCTYLSYDRARLRVVLHPANLSVGCVSGSDAWWRCLVDVVVQQCFVDGRYGE